MSQPAAKPSASSTDAVVSVTVDRMGIRDRLRVSIEVPEGEEHLVKISGLDDTTGRHR